MLPFDNLTPPEPGILPARFKAVDHAEANAVVLWDCGDFFVKRVKPIVWCAAPYAGEQEQAEGLTRLRVIAGILNQARSSRDIVDVS